MKSVLIQKRTKIGERTFFGGKQVLEDALADALIATGNASLVGLVPDSTTEAAEAAPVIAKDHYGRASVESKAAPAKPVKPAPTEDK